MRCEHFDVQLISFHAILIVLPPFVFVASLYMTAALLLLCSLFFCCGCCCPLTSLLFYVSVEIIVIKRICTINSHIFATITLSVHKCGNTVWRRRRRCCLSPFLCCWQSAYVCLCVCLPSCMCVCVWHLACLQQQQSTQPTFRTLQMK